MVWGWFWRGPFFLALLQDLSLYMPGSFSLFFRFSLLPFLNPPRPWAPRGTCPPKWSRLQGARCRACRAPSRKTANASWLSFLVWSAMSGPRSTLTIGLLPRIQPRADSSCQFPPSKKSLNQNHFHCNPTLFSISQKF